jgi:diguanylate cyclase (GGDEF)-like protein
MTKSMKQKRINSRRELVRFMSYDDYYGKQVYPIVYKMSKIGVVIAFILTAQEYALYGYTSILKSFFLSCVIASLFIMAIAFVAVYKRIPANKRATIIVILGAICELIFISANIIVKYSLADIIIANIFVLLFVICISPMIKLGLFLFSNVVLYIMVGILLVYKKVDYAEDVKILLFFLVSTFFVGFILKNLKRSFENLYISAHENYLHSNLDTLSQLLNRRSWYAHSEKQFRHAAEHKELTAFIMLDVDMFKKINDSYGHSCGDFVIQEISRILLEHTRNTDIVGRLGGEEFGILLKVETRKEAQATADRIRETVESLVISYEEYKIKVTISMGLAFADGDNLDNLIKKSDACLYTAKKSGRNKVVIENE